MDVKKIAVMLSDKHLIDLNGFRKGHCLAGSVSLCSSGLPFDKTT
ncbi:MAG: hypothetical protein Q8O06_05960 [Acetobacterium sp.]|nr:hypothetical protein [Acetobacterium sp.]